VGRQGSRRRRISRLGHKIEASGCIMLGSAYKIAFWKLWVPREGFHQGLHQKQSLTGQPMNKITGDSRTAGTHLLADLDPSDTHCVRSTWLPLLCRSGNFKLELPRIFYHSFWARQRINTSTVLVLLGTVEREEGNDAFSLVLSNWGLSNLNPQLESLRGVKTGGSSPLRSRCSFWNES
jgi:hypothetical protein